MRSAAHFGISTIFADARELGLDSAALLRVAEGGAEFVDLIPVSDFLKVFEPLSKLGFGFVGATANGKKSLFDSRLTGRQVLVLGSETLGLEPGIEKLLTQSLYQIPGTGRVESLNISVAASLFCSEYFRQNLGAPNG